MINNRWIKRIGIALISIIAVLFILSFYISYFLNDRLPKIIAEKNDTAYNLTYEDLSFSVFNSSLSLKNVEVSPKDSLLIKDSIDATGKVKEINVVGINFFKLITKKEVAALSININNPSVNYYLKEKKDSIKKDTAQSKVGQSIDVSNVNINNGEFNLYSQSGKKHIANVSNFSIDFDGVRFNERTADKKIPFRYSAFDIKLDSMFFVVKDQQLIRARKVRFNETDFELDNFLMKPLKMNGKMYVPNDSENDLLDIESPLLSLSKMDWGFTSEDKLYFKTDLIKFKNPKITIISAKPENKVEKQSTKKVSIKTEDAELINIKKLQIEDGKIRSLFSNAKTVKYAVNNVALNIEGIKMNALTRTNDIPIDYKTFRIKLDSMYYRLNEMHTLTASNFDLTEKKLILKNFKMKPLISKNQFNRNYTKSNTLLDVEAPILTLNNNSWGIKNGDFYFHTNSIKLDEVNVKIIDQKNEKVIAKKVEKATQKFLINFNLGIDTIQIKQSRFIASQKFDFNNVNLTVLGLKNDYGKELHINHVIFKNPKFTIYGQPRRVAQREGKTSKAFNDVIKVDKISLVNGHLDVIPYQQKTPNLTLKQIQLTFNQINVDPKTIQEAIPFSYKSVLLKSSGIDFDLGKTYKMNTGALQFQNGNLTLNQLKLMPKLSRKAYTASLKKQADLYTVSVKQLQGNGIQWGISPSKDFFLKANQIKLNQLYANIYRSLVPPDDTKRKTMFSQKLREMKFDLGVKQLQLVNSKLEYEEETAKSIGTGKLTFSSINATVKNVNSGYRKKSLPDVNVDWRSEFMNGDLRANWTFNPMNRSEKFNINGSISKLPAKNLDPFVKPYLKVSVDGFFNQIKFNFDGNDKAAGGNFGIDYQNLKVNVLRDDGSKRKLLSAVGNAAVKNDSRGKMKEEKVENIERKQDKSFFNFFLACILDGLKKALLII
ncbi:hypothetical protein [Empedobacter falsenii]|uniref:hypothetical protein n=1 Tax=Empedobacter falsenii TaxID=343874 RepID=UPI00056FD69C|nr:hypothetical protein [Empedobacter falsenii]